jgi:hypothetical protein
MTQTMQLHHISEEMQRCIQTCLTCHRVCHQTVLYCLQQGDDHAEAKHIALVLDCAEVCHTNTDLMLRNSPLHQQTSAVCAELCHYCMNDCQRFAGDAQMKACVDACRNCAESCRAIAIAS